MTKSTLDKLRAELDDWRARLDHLRVQASLGKMEARDELEKLGHKLEPTISEARKRIDSAVRSGTTEAKHLGESLRAGWDALRRTHRELSEEAERKRK